MKKGILAAALATFVGFGALHAEYINMEKYDLHNLVNKNCKDIQMLKKAVAKMIIELEKNKKKWKGRLEKKYDIIKKKKKGKCSIITKVYIDKEQIKYSYNKYKKPKKFTVMTKTAYIYNYPALYGTEIIGEFHKGDTFYGDMFTYPGWVHAEGKGWVRGFKLKPKVLYDKEHVNTNKKQSAYVYVKEKVCNGIGK